MKFLGLTLIFVLITNYLFGQIDKVQNIHSIKARLFQMSYDYEQSLSQKLTIDFEFTIDSRISVDLNGNSSSDWLLYPAIRIEPRYYYNYNKRKERGKNVTNNSANYFTLTTIYRFPSIVGNYEKNFNTIVIIPKWGLKRAINKHFIFELALGVGVHRDYYSFSKGWEALIGLDLGLGYSF